MGRGRLLIIGAGGHGRVTADAARASGEWSEIAFVDDKYPDLSSSGGWPVVGSSSDLMGLSKKWDTVIVGIGDNAIRLELQQSARSFGFSIATVIHPSAQVAEGVEIGEGSVVFANAVINTGCRLGISVIINTAATVDHDCIIGDSVHISPGAHLAGDVMVEDCVWIGIGSVIINGLRIGQNAIVAAGASVTRDVIAAHTVGGVPAVDIR